MDKKSFILYHDYFENLKEISNEEIGILIRALAEYSKTGNIIELPSSLKIAFNFIKTDIDINKNKWEKTCENRKQAGQKGGLAKASKASKSKQNLANLADNDNVNDNDSDSDNDNEECSSVEEEEKNSNKKFLGECFNVLLSEQEIKEIETYKAIGKDKALELINALSRSIDTGDENEHVVSGKGHLTRLKAYADYRLKNPEKFRERAEPEKATRPDSKVIERV